MDANVLIIDNILARTGVTERPLSNPNVGAFDTLFKWNENIESTRIHNTEKATTDNKIEEDLLNQPIRAVNRQKNSETPLKAQSNSKSQKQEPTKSDSRDSLTKMESEAPDGSFDGNIVSKIEPNENGPVADSGKIGNQTKSVPKNFISENQKSALGKGLGVKESETTTVIKDHSNKNAVDMKVQASDAKALLQFSENRLKNEQVQSLSSSDSKTDSKVTVSQTSADFPNGNKSIRTAAESLNHRVAQNVNITGIQISNGQLKNFNNDSTGKDIGSNTQQSASGFQMQSFISEPDVNALKDSGADNMMRHSSPGEQPANIGKQILESIHHSLTQQGADKQISVRLNPPELGEVLIKFQEQQTQITGLLEVSKAQTRVEIEQALPQIIRNLADSGIEIKRLDVVLTGGSQSQQEALKDNSMFGEHQQQNWANPEHPSYVNNFGMPDDRLTYNINYPDGSGLQDVYIADNSINILL